MLCLSSWAATLVRHSRLPTAGIIHSNLAPGLRGPICAREPRTGCGGSACLICASFGCSNLENADLTRRCRFRNSQQKRASVLDPTYVWLTKLPHNGAPCLAYTYPRILAVLAMNRVGGFGARQGHSQLGYGSPARTMRI